MSVMHLPTAADDPPPGWVLPAVALGLAMPALGSSARRDADLLLRLPPLPTERFTRLRTLPGLPAATLTALALGLALVFGFVRLGITDVYTESWLFLVLAIALGLLSPGAGLLLVIAFAPMDLLAVITRGQLDPLLPALAGRVISWWLLWLLAVVLPLVARQVPGAVLAAGRPDSPVGRRLIAYAAAAVTMAGLLWLWAGAVSELIRPVFTWTSILGEPRPSVTGPVTDGRDTLLLAAALALVLVTMGRDLMRVVDDETAAAITPPVPADRVPSLPVRLRPMRWVAATAMGLLLLGAMVTAPLDMVLLGGALLLGRPGVRRLLRRFPVVLLLLGQVPWLLRFALGCVGAWITSTVLTLVLGGPALGSERLPVVVATAAAILVIALLLEVDAAADDLLREREERAQARAAAATAPDAETREGPIVLPPSSTSVARGSRPSAARVAAGSLLLGVALPVLAFAQSPAPCAVGDVCLPPAAMSAAAATGAAALLALTMGVGGRFVGPRRDVASRRPGGAVSRPAGLRGLLAQGRVAMLAAWRAG